jgi:hypothetical protein
MATRSLTQIPVSFNGTSFLLDVADGKLISLNTIYAAAGSPAFHEPKFWLRSVECEKFIENLCLELKVDKSHLIKVTRGKGGGTWAHWKIAAKYACHLEPKLESAILDVFRERVQEEIDPELGIKRSRERAIASWRRQGRNEDWIEQRCSQIDNWHGFTDTLKAHGVQGEGYGRCADSLNVPILGGTSKQIRKERQIATKSLRDGLDEVENAAINFAQVLAKKKIKDNNIIGNRLCATACYQSAEKVAAII